MKKEQLQFIINSTVLYVLAFVVTTFIHELAHAIVGLINGSNPILHHNFVEHTTTLLSVNQKVSIALAGPLASLVQGLILGIVFLSSSNRTLINLFFLWLSILGFTNFFGYLMTGPLFQAGDIGKVFLLLELSLIIQIGIAVFGALVISFIAYKVTTPFLEFSYRQEWIRFPKSRTNFLFRIIIIPWLIGSFAVTLLYLPVIAIVSIIYPFTSGMIFIFPWKNGKRIQHVKLSSNDLVGKPSVVLYTLFVFSVLVFKFFLAPGIPF